MSQLMERNVTQKKYLSIGPKSDRIFRYFDLNIFLTGYLARYNGALSHED
jgi:hypothetical protein